MNVRVTGDYTMAGDQVNITLPHLESHEDSDSVAYNARTGAVYSPPGLNKELESLNNASVLR